jgi:hypothetical protein
LRPATDGDFPAGPPGLTVYQNLPGSSLEPVLDQ